MTNRDRLVPRPIAPDALVSPPLDVRGERMARVWDPFGHPSILHQRAPSTSRAEDSGSIAFLGASELARRIRAGELGSLAVTEMLIDRIERLDAPINAIAVRDFEQALEAARAADAAQARGELLGPLHGVPVTLKESFDVEALPTTWGNPAYAGNVARADSEVAHRLRRAGAHIVAKTNVARMLADYQTANPLYGATKNPHDPARGVGGSSGGAAAALAAGLTFLDVGSDLGGSIRNPAHYCGVFGHKPTGGLVSMRGHALPGVLPPPELAVVGPLARAAEDLAVAVRVLASEALAPPRATSLRTFRVAIWSDDSIAPVDAAVSERARAVGDAVERAGGKTSVRARPAFDPAHSRATFAALVRAFMNGATADAALLADAAAIGRAWAAFFDEWDVLVCPVMPTSARPLDDPPPLSDVTWSSFATLAGLPATAFPMGHGPDGLPLGLQAIGAKGADLTTIAFAALVASGP